MDSFTENTMIITPIKKFPEGNQNLIVTSSKSSKKHSNQNSKTAEMMLKYQTIENANGKHVNSGFKNHTQSNFN